LNTISFEIVTLRINALVTAFLPLLECGLKVILCKRVHNHLQFVLDLGKSVRTATFQLHLHLWEKEEVCWS
jgi:UDP-glucose 6-dehydrogenase